MTSDLIQLVLHESSYSLVYAITLAYFLLLYFGIGSLFQFICKWLSRKKILFPIIRKALSPGQVSFEIKHSLVSIIIFGFSGVAFVYMVRNGSIELKADSILNILTGLLILNIWNELHFFIVHKLMHQPFFYRYVHKIHHRSKVPAVFSVYSFHPFEALLLSTVPLIIAPFINFSIYAIMLYPLSSILLNFAGHCNYRFGNGTGSSLKLFATRHAQHHNLNSKTFGFATDFLDRLTLKLKIHDK